MKTFVSRTILILYQPQAIGFFPVALVLDTTALIYLSLHQTAARSTSVNPVKEINEIFFDVRGVYLFHYKAVLVAINQQLGLSLDSKLSPDGRGITT